LRRCSKAARGAWIDTLCALHDSDEYGIARYPLRELADVVASPIKLLLELAEKAVLKGSDTQLVTPYVYEPFHGGKYGSPVVLVPAQAGPIWFSSRFVRDEYLRTTRGAATRFGANHPPDASPSRRVGERQGEPPDPTPSRRQVDGASSASASASALRSSEPLVPVRPPPAASAGADGPKTKANGHRNGHAKATRLPDGWSLPDDWRQWAREAHDIDPQRAVRISLSFRDYWHAKPKDATRLDWFATWRNWVRKEIGDA